jgi:Ca2+-binding EF-hand superfamily protein
MMKLLIGGAALVLAVPALAQIAPAPTPAPRAEKIQTRADVQAKIAKHFARLDSNRDGFVTKAEADAATEAFRGKREERRADRREHAFERLDTNRDGAITKAEWDSAQAKRNQRIEARDKNGDGRPDGKRFGRGGMGRFGGHVFEMADANKDGRVSLQEAQNAALQHFDAVDSNRDGQITREERMQMHQRMRAAHKQG